MKARLAIAGIIGLVILIGGLYLFSSSQYITKRIGGTTTIELPAGKKLVLYTV